MEEDEFVDLVLDKYDKKRKYAAYLEQEGSILADTFKNKESLFRMRNNSSMNEQEENQ